MKWLYILALCALAFAESPEENSDNPAMFEGDMMLTTVQRMAALGLGRAAVKDTNRLWPKGQLFYAIDKSLAKEKAATGAINAAIAEYHKKTCIRLIKRNSKNKDYVNFKLGSGCSSFVGKRGGKQDINLGRTCWRKGTVVHEIGHALGFYHEQSRPDRDKFVTILWQNIKDDFKSNFRKLSWDVVNTLGFAYDYNSVMHYGGTFFSKNDKPTIVPKKKGAKIGQRVGLSTVDKNQLNNRYKFQCKRRG